MWYEWDSDKPTVAALNALYEALRHVKPRRWHWFFGEPWSPWVVRFLIEGDAPELPKLMRKGAWREIDLSEDERAYGNAWRLAVNFFETASEVGLYVATAHWTGHDIEDDAPLLFPAKLIHCALNAWGFDYPDEVSLYFEAMNRSQIIDTLMTVFPGKADLLNETVEYLCAGRQRGGAFKW